ncbi:MAG TPA: serine/threonine-protein kinase [Pirellulaceae bacterium]|jgi:serine/threonine-protein kinase|nr:serine/threonine-protein kinase [Pirellulaceae bacterium]
MSEAKTSPVDREERLAVALTKALDAVQRGQAPDLEAYCEGDAAMASELRELLGMASIANFPRHVSPTIVDDRPVEPRRDADPPPSRFGDYEILREIGRGGMGIVYRARQISLQRDVALKLTLHGALTGPAERERFRIEAESAAKLEHPNIVPVHDVGEYEGRPYLSMQLVEGETLADRVKRGPLPPVEAARLLLPVCRAVAFAHRRGVLHRDLKPSNILLDRNDVPHLTDFGLAKAMENDVALTRTGAALGTPSYIPPEQAAGNRGECGPASDVYSLGAVLYHTLVGRPPFAGASPVETVLMVLEQEPPLPRAIYPKVDRDLEIIALKCLQKPIDLRYESADALAADLKAYLNDEPIAARSGRLSQVFGRMLRETHHASVLENWGLLWMWHSLVLFIACALTNVLGLAGVTSPWWYLALWTAGFGAWAAVFWTLRRRMGPVLFVERQIAHVWGASLICIATLFPIEVMLGLGPLTLSPVLGLVAGMVFFVKAGMLSGAFYIQSAALFATAFLMVMMPEYAHVIFGAVAAACFFFPGWKYWRQRLDSQGR